MYRVSNTAIARRFLTIAALALPLTACAHKKPAPPATEPAVLVPADPIELSRNLQDRVETLGVQVADLPGTADKYRPRVQEALTTLSQLVPLLGGPAPSGAFRQQVDILNASRASLASSDPDQVTTEHMIDSALRAAASALTSVAAERFADRAELKPSLENLHTRIADLDTVRGPLHDASASEALRALHSVSLGMSLAINERASTANLATPEPPARTPTTSPSTSP